MKIDIRTVCRVLIVEDDEALAGQLRETLERFEKDRGVPFDVAVTPDAVMARELANAKAYDIFVVDLELPYAPGSKNKSRTVGMLLLPDLVQNPDTGTIVYSTQAKTEFFELTMQVGVDDYIQKDDNPSFVVEKIIAVWRRILSARIDKANLEKQMGRSFRVGEWRFTIGNQTLAKISGEKTNIGITEHEFLKHLVLAYNNSIDVEGLKMFVVRRTEDNDDVYKKTIENTIYRLRKKLGSTFNLAYQGGGYYKLLDVEAL